ncbi:protein mitoshell [Anopheles darlingi]|uniref:protein mitoshell n=1 Tax=Anopheles darlingi TaxID=43151 RepID=UPI0021000DE3|nr:protein mitoshell [Anopheles darlingi]
MTVLPPVFQTLQPPMMQANNRQAYCCTNALGSSASQQPIGSSLFQPLRFPVNMPPPLFEHHTYNYSVMQSSLFYKATNVQNCGVPPQPKPTLDSSTPRVNQGETTVPINIPTSVGSCSSTSPSLATENDDHIDGDVPNTEHIDELIEIALQGCKLAESLATNYQKRPCFKKIDSLCARLKQDLLKPDNVLSNINSQGLAWAVKDFIFVFTRIMNAWNIIKGYARSEPRGLAYVQQELCPNFLKAFGQWHKSTLQLTQSLVTSFTNLDKLAKSHRGSATGFPMTLLPGGYRYESSTADAEPQGEGAVSFPNNDGEYIRTGVYKTLRKPPGFDDLPKAMQKINVHDQNDTDACREQRFTMSVSSQESSSPSTPLSPVTTLPAAPPPSPADQIQEHGMSDEEWNELFNRSELQETCPNDVVEAYSTLMRRVLEIKESEYFINIWITKAYFPDFYLCGPSFNDLRTIFSNTKKGIYPNIKALLSDLQKLIKACMTYLNVHLQE